MHLDIYIVLLPVSESLKVEFFAAKSNSATDGRQEYYTKLYLVEAFQKRLVTLLQSNKAIDFLRRH